ncbi:16S rRNA (guanine(527)-N(7))-methyltransferase RsmG [Corynebacterium sp. H78]|uniref:16S rRNA (guanine(527)-N(7))-methyltransferase RsmG n=1 Tax=Corynebacterium sp. H78 TaxID=3133417 RepID=UPI0030A0C140
MSDDIAAPREAEEIPAEPTIEIERVFGENADKAREYWGWLSAEATVRGLIGPREVPRLWERHILNCAAVGDAIEEDKSVVDIGSGAGLPGIPLALARPDLTITLLEPLLRRTTFLDEVVADLALENVTVVRGRAEEKAVVKQIGAVDVATSRAVAPLGKLAKWSLPLVRTGGHMIALKGSTAAEEIERDARDIKKAKGMNAEVIEVGSEYLATPTYVVRIEKK